MTLSEAISTCMGKYADFSGRASRSEYWWFFLFALLLSWASSLVGFTVNTDWGSDVLNMITNLALLLPSLAVSARRLHDTGRSGWWYLLVLTIIGIIVLLIWWAQEGSKSENKFGLPPNPN